MTRIEPESTHVCPHCGTTVRFVAPNVSGGGAAFLVYGKEHQLAVVLAHCPHCDQHVMTATTSTKNVVPGEWTNGESHMVWPRSTGRPPLSQHVPTEMAKFYGQAALIIGTSPEASAALSRRVLQTVLSDKGGTKKRDLADQIDEVMPKLPSYIAQSLDVVRVIGNFAAHPTKSTQTGVIMEVEPGEAEWNLDVLDAVFDFYYVGPEIEKAKRAALNVKLAEAGKPTLP